MIWTGSKQLENPKPDGCSQYLNNGVINLNFSELIRLKTLRIRMNRLGGFDAALMPNNLGSFSMSLAKHWQFPDFSSHTPIINTISLNHNIIQ